MLYVFHVDTGSMLMLDINLTLESVIQLKETIENCFDIPANEQVLLVSGGECLDSCGKVGAYSGGTDTNPLFLFTRSSTNAYNQKELTCRDFNLDDEELLSKVDDTLKMAPSLSTVICRAQLAQQFLEVAREYCTVCDKLVLDQHLQHQGWTAAVANLDDNIAAFKAKYNVIEQNLIEILDSREEYLQLLNGYEVDLESLSKIPLVPALVKDRFSDDFQEPPATLLDWMETKEDFINLRGTINQCRSYFDRFNHDLLEKLQANMATILTKENDQDFREIKGLAKRLGGLDVLMSEARKKVQEQADLAQAFQQNQVRASKLNDASILPDLCDSHHRQLEVMIENQVKLKDILTRCLKAKRELCDNLYSRLQCVVFIENAINEMTTKMSLYEKSLRKLRECFNIIQQIHVAPQIYFTAITEVVRRRMFSESFLLWAGDLSCHLCAIHSEEVLLRKNFHDQFEGHFLNSLFTGFEDVPPPFATQPPGQFDHKLPEISPEDICRLRLELPDLSISTPDISHVTQFFLARSIAATLKTEPNDPAASIEDRIVEAVTAVGLNSNLDPALLQPADSQISGPSYTQPTTSDRGFESETDTEEFVKVGQSPTELAFDNKQEIPPHQAQENLSALKETIQRIGEPMVNSLMAMKNDVSSLKESFLAEKKHLCCLLNDLTNTYNKCIEDKNLQIQELMMDLQRKNSDLSKLKDQSDELENRLKISSDMASSERSKREEAENFNEENKCKISQMSREFKEEIERVRSRFRLMSSASVDRIPIEAEKDRGDLIEIRHHEEIVNQLKENLEIEKQEAVSQVKKMWEKRLQNAKIQSESEKQISINETLKRVVSEKDKKLEFMSMQVTNFQSDCQKLKDTINMLVENGCGSSDGFSLTERVEALESAKERLERELLEARGYTARTRDTGTSFSLFDKSFPIKDASTSPEHYRRAHMREKLTNSATTLIAQDKLSIMSCNVGDTVLVMWDERWQNYMIYQESATLYFLHSDCVETLQLGYSGGEESIRRTRCIGEVMEKEYCHAKKVENRYHVPQGTKFYRVKVKPILNRSHHSQHSQSTSSLGST